MILLSLFPVHYKLRIKSVLKPLRVNQKSSRRQDKTKSQKGGGFGHYSRMKSHEKVSVFFGKIMALFMFIVLVIGFGVAGYVYQIYSKLPDITTVETFLPNETTKIYSADGVVLAELHREENRMRVPLSRISPILKKALVAVEDQKFYHHHGVDFFGTFRALVANFKEGGRVQGGSTITQQLARNLFLSQKKRMSRKIGEAILAMKLERHYSKQEILEMYLNQVYWGHNAYGIESAAQIYFGVHAAELTLAQSAILVGMLSGPEIYSPYRNLRVSTARKVVVLERLLKQKIITKVQFNEAKNESIILVGMKAFRYKAPYFCSIIIERLIKMYGEELTYNSGLRVYTPIIWSLQQQAERVVEDAIIEGQKPHETEAGSVSSLNYNQGALLSMVPQTGYIVAMVGGYDFLHYQFNKAYQAKRQPGSAFKPFVYLTALSKGYSPGTIFIDSPVVFNTFQGPYRPLNYDKKFDGPMPMRKGLEQSKNIIALKIMSMIGASSVIDTARAFGLTAPFPKVLSLALGAGEVSMIELVTAYGSFATGGIKTEPVFITKIEDRNGLELYRANVKQERVFDEDIVWTLVEMMQGVINNGTGKGAQLPRPIAGKTGTTSDYRDAWFIGFVPQLVTGTWVGNDDNSSMKYVTGGWIPATMWREYMKIALANIPAMDFPKAKGLVEVKICWDSGKRASAHCPSSRTTIEKFWVDRVPAQFCPLSHSGGSVPVNGAKDTSAPSGAEDATPQNDTNYGKEFLN